MELHCERKFSPISRTTKSRLFLTLPFRRTTEIRANWMRVLRNASGYLQLPIVTPRLAG